MPLPRTTAASDGENQADLGRVDLLVAWNAHGPAQAARAKALAERGAHAIAGVGRHTAEGDACGPDPIDFGQRHLGLGLEGAPLVRHARPVQAIWSDGPALGQEQAQADRTGTSPLASVSETSVTALARSACGTVREPPLP